MHATSHIPEARRHLAAARAELYQHARAQPGEPHSAVERAAEHADAALEALDTYGMDVRPGMPDDFLRQ